MKGTNTILAPNFRKAVMLLGIYALHLLFFQALMAAPAQKTESKTFKPLFIHKEKAQHPISHPAVSYSSILLKQAVCSVPSFETAPIIVSQLTDYVPDYTMASAVYSARGNISHIAEDTFKLYRLLHTFLI